MKGYKSIEDYSLKECCDFLSAEENKKDPLYDSVEERYQQMLQELEQQDVSDFSSCKTCSDYESYIKKYSDKNIAQYYKAKYIGEARKNIEELFWKSHRNSDSGCKKYLGNYPKGRYAHEANKRIRRSKRVRWITMGIILVTLIIAFFIGYRPVSSLSISESSVHFDKWGGESSVKISTNVPANAVSIECEGIGFYTDKDNGYDTHIKAEPNEGDYRTGTIKVSAFTTLYGMRIGSGKDITIKLSQESGLATKLKTSITSIDASKWGGQYSFTVQNDGVKEENISASADWIRITKTDKGSYSVSIEKNPDDKRTAQITIETPAKTRSIRVNQASGLARTFSLKGTKSINVNKNGTEAGRCYKISVSTDGVSWDIYSNPTWTEITKYDNFFEITVEANSEEIREGKVVVHSNNGHSESVYIHQDGDPTNFYPNRSSIRFDTDGGNMQVSITNNSNQSISASSNKSWLSSSVTGNTVKIYCSSNSNEPRDGTISIRCGHKEKTIEVHQKGWRKCKSCNNGRQSCPHNNSMPWSTEFGSYYYTYQNGRHILIRAYTDWSMGIPMPAVNKTECSTCDGDGWINCRKCGGKGKIKED